MRWSRGVVIAVVALLAISLAAPVALAGGAVANTDEASGLEFGDERAALDIHQPTWIDTDPTVDRRSNQTIYEVRGDRFEIALENVDHDHVEQARVVDGGADVEHDTDRDLWIVEPDGEGTVAIQWVAAEPVIDDEGNETGEVERTQYAASLRVSDTEWEHLQVDELESVEQDAANWSAVEREAEQIAPDRSTESVLSTGFGAAEFLISPFSSLTADIQGTLIMMTMRPGGLLVLGTFLSLIAITAAAGFRWRHRFQTQLGDHDRIQEELTDAWLQKARRVLQQCDWPDLFPDHVAQTMHDLWGPNVWQGFKNYQLLRSPTHTKGLWLQMMSQIGYSGVVHYDADGRVTKARALTPDQIEEIYGGIDVDGGVEGSSRSDGDDDGDDGDGGSRPDVVDVGDGGFRWSDVDDDAATDGGVLETEEIGRVNFEHLRFDDPAHRAIIDAIPADDMDEAVFLPSIEIDPALLSLPIDNHDIDDAELVRILNPEVPGDFESYEEMARVHGTMLEFVTTHPAYTDAEGRVREEMDLLSFLSEMDSVLADKAEFATADIQRKMNYWIAEHMDADGKMEETLTDAFEEGVGRTDTNPDDVIGPDDVDLGSRFGRSDRSNPGGDGP